MSLNTFVFCRSNSRSSDLKRFLAVFFHHVDFVHRTQELSDCQDRDGHQRLYRRSWPSAPNGTWSCQKPTSTFFCPLGIRGIALLHRASNSSWVMPDAIDWGETEFGGEYLFGEGHRGDPVLHGLPWIFEVWDDAVFCGIVWSWVQRNACWLIFIWLSWVSKEPRRHCFVSQGHPKTCTGF